MSEKTVKNEENSLNLADFDQKTSKNLVKVGNEIPVLFCKVREGAKVPTQETGSAGLDFYACFNEDYIKIKPHTCELIPTGIKYVISPDYWILLEERGSTGTKNMKRNAGVLDSNFRGEVFVCLYNGNNYPLYIAKEGVDPKMTLWEKIKNALGLTVRRIYPYNKAIAQGIVLPQYDVISGEISKKDFEFYSTNRGEGMLGSSGK